MDGMDSTWSADHLRVSLFSNVVWSTPAEEIFSNVFGSSPETITKKPASNEVSVVGNWDGLKLELNAAFNRIDFIVQDVSSEASPIHLINNVNSILPEFSSLIANWAAIQPEGLLRIALGCNGFLKAQSVEDSYVKLKELIKVIHVDVKRFREFRFQVNLPITSLVYPDININRLSHWGAITLRPTLLQADASQHFNDEYFVSCSLDVNTDGERTQPIPGDLINKLTEELSLICINTLNLGIS